MSVTAEIATDLLTPLGAYLRLREGARAAFLLESVERGRLGRHSFVGRGSRIVDLAEAEPEAARPRHVPRHRAAWMMKHSCRRSSLARCRIPLSTTAITCVSRGCICAVMG